jgi:hypothetical protein
MEIYRIDMFKYLRGEWKTDSLISDECAEGSQFHNRFGVVPRGMGKGGEVATRACVLHARLWDGV